jgi:hypothetical protein
MGYRRKLFILFFIVLLVALIEISLPGNPGLIHFYDKYLFHPFQGVRNLLFELIPFSVGDILYIFGGLALVFVICKWVLYLVRFRTHRHKLSTSLLRTLIVAGIVYIIFFLGWGGNYYKPSLTEHWQLDRHLIEPDSALISFDRYLIGEMNAYAPGYRPASFREMGRKARTFYLEHTNSSSAFYGIKVKPSIFGFLMQRFAIQGYYNPFTGEAQVNRFLPGFMLPFVICHEMAHQSGIAAEDDANLLSYVVSTAMDDSSFKYSAYFNLWLYTHARLRMKDSSSASLLFQSLNTISMNHLDTLREIRRRYHSDMSDYSGILYDGYLKFHHQKDGIESYNRVAFTAWAWENRKRKDGGMINLP